MSESESSDEDCAGLLKKALAVDLPANFNPYSVPQNGEEYLHHVIYERSKCKKLMTSNIDPNKFISKQTVHIVEGNTKRIAPDSCRPTIEWQNNTLNDFTNFRKYVHSKITSEPSITSFNEGCFLEKVNNEIPLFSEITQYSQSSKIRMLQIIANYLDAMEPGESIGDNLGTWIYAILVLLELPLSPSCCHTLREFAKKCAVIRSNLSDGVNKSLCIPLNLYICLVARYFNQLDLTD